MPALIGLLFKKPKILIPIAIVFALIYFGRGCLGGSGTSDPSTDILSLFTGAEFSEVEYDKAEVYAPLADNRKNPLPERISLKEFCPTPRNQGSQGSCVGWSSGYAARTILESRASGSAPNRVAFSPASLYNQISLPDCQGAYIIKAMQAMKQVGVLPWADHPYDENNCDEELSRAGIQKAARFKMRGFNRLTPNDDPRGVDLLAIKQNLAQGAPVVIGMMVGGSFMNPMNGRKIWKPRNSDYRMAGFGGHAMCVIGYDDFYEGGAFQIMNSWGKKWGNEGFAWVRYSDFAHFTKEAYGLYPMGNSAKLDPSRFEAAFALIDQSNNQALAMNQIGEFEFETALPLEKLSKFKIEVTNNVECYTYIFGQDTDGSSYILFPYTPKHSPYCGITGTRLFPRDGSLQPDEIGDRDYFAIVVSKQPLDYLQYNQLINGGRGSSFSQKIANAFNGQIKRNVRFRANSEDIEFSTDTNGDELVIMVIGVDKI